MSKDNEYTNEELQKLWDKKQKEDKIRQVARIRCDKIKKELINDILKLETIRPLWHTDKSLIDFNNQKTQVNLNIFKDGYTIIESVEIELLLNSFQEYYPDPKPFRDNVLFSEAFTDWKICGVIDNWINQIKLIPPIILWNELLDKTFAADGKHRLKVTCIIGEEHIPIIIPNSQLSEVKRLIGITQ